MTREQWAKLTDDEKRIKVAELSGWKYIKRITRSGDSVLLSDMWPGSILKGLPQHDSPGSNGIFGDQLVPDYLHDLNAMHEALTAVPEHKQSDLISTLFDLVGWKPTPLSEPLPTSAEYRKWDWMFLTSIAAQQAEAFVLTMEPE